jgi:SAM-dependent methyltransferase
LLKENDIRPADLYEKYLEMSAADALIYFNSSERRQIPCPACENPYAHPVFEKCGFRYVVCNYCSTLYQSPRPPFEDFARFYQDSPSSHYWVETFFPAVAEVRRESLFRPKVIEINKLCQSSNFFPQVVVDVGAGYGLFLEAWREKFPNTEVIAVEPNKTMAAICRSKKLGVLECFAEEAESLNDKVDLVVGLEVIEHVHNPLIFVCSLCKLLKSGGHILLTGLTVDGFDIQVLWEHSRSVCPPHHINFMSIKGFEDLFIKAGFKNIQVFTPGKLDVDIVRNALSSKTDILDEQRFIRTLLGQSQETAAAFQHFLSENRLSSHCWVWAEK